MVRLSLVLPIAVLLLAACGSSGNPVADGTARSPEPTATSDAAVRILDVGVEDDGTTLRLALNICNPDEHDAEVVASDEESVRVRATAEGGSENDDCAAGALVTLDEPLGDRVVIDATTGEEVETTS